jgi:HD-GYP domain-containing protein (c-di-GMP phosphodiesterase class II)
VIETPRATGDEGAIRASGRGLLITLHTALRSLKLYPVENAATQKALDELQAATVAFLKTEQEIELRLSGDFLFLNSVRLRLELDNFAAFSGVLSMLRAFDVGVLRVHGPVERREWLAFLSILLRLAADPEPQDRFVALVERMAEAGLPDLQVEPASTSPDELGGERDAKELAKRTYAQGVAVTKEVVNSVRMGRSSSLKKVKRAVQLIVDQVLNNETSIIGLTTLRDYDEYTFMHSVNVCIFAVALGRKIGFSRLQLYDLGMTALLHDIGKAKVPIEITNKTSNLEEDEWRAMQAHPWLGALSLFRLRGYDEIPYRSILVAHEHHMKRDLSGYPRHVRPRDLGLFTRLVAVADGFDAGTTRRSYQTVPWEPDQVLKEMWSNPNRGLDPVLVKALINLIGIYPVGTCVILDTLEVGIVASTVADRDQLNRPVVRIAIDADGGPVAPPGIPVDLQEKGPAGGYVRSIVKVTSPERYGLVPGDFFV